MNRGRNDMSYKNGSLPGATAPLAMAYVPMQSCVSPSYEAGEALARGTLFPGLDLPLMNIVNDEVEMTPLTELMSISFVTDELGLYLDTHSDDREAFDMYQTFLALKKEAEKRYTEKFGPVCKTDMLGMNSYSWLRDPWPWEYQSRRES